MLSSQQHNTSLKVNEVETKNDFDECKKRKLETGGEEKNKRQTLDMPSADTYYRFISAMYQHFNENKSRDRKQIVKFLKTYFKLNDTLTWPNNNVKLHITIDQLSGNTCQINLKGGSSQSQQFSLRMFIENENTFILDIAETPEWSINDIHDVIHHFNYLFAANIIYADELKERYEEKLDVTTPLNWFENSSDLQKVSDRLSSQIALPYFLTYHANAEEDSHAFWLSWKPEQFKDLSLRISLTSISFADATYHPWTFAEEEFAKLYNYPKEQQYIRMTIHEHVSENDTVKSDIQIVDAFFNLTFTMGELRDVSKGNKLNGTEILLAFEDISKSLCRLGRLAYIGSTDMYLCDASRSDKSGDREPGQNVFRISHSLAKGKTLYESFGYKVVTIANVKQGWPKANYNFFQDSSVYENDRNTLRSYSVKEIYDYFKNEALANKRVRNTWHRKNEQQRAENINSLCKKLYGIDLNDEDVDMEDTKVCPTVGQLAAKVYGLFKANNRDNAKDFQTLHDAFILPDKYNVPTNRLFLSQRHMNVHDLQRTLLYTQIFKKNIN